jgi:CRP-like cAMP-binding protein
MKDANCATCTVRSRALFGSVSEEEVRFTQKYRNKYCAFSAGEVLHQEQDKINYAFTLHTGCLILYNRLLNGNRQILRVVLPGDFVGFSRNSKGKLLYSIEAIMDAKICLFSDDSVSKMTSEHPEIGKRLMDLQLNDVALYQQQLLSLGQKTATESLAYLIMELYTRIKVQAPEMCNDKNNEVFFPLNQSDMGDALGLTNVHINRVISTFKKQGLITFKYKRISVLNEDKLSEIGQFDVGLIKDPFRHFS